jgi:opacity protein-like surface antigen
VTGSLGYNLFYNTQNNGKNRTKWNIFNLGAGMEYNFTPKQKERIYTGLEINYNFMFGAWQSDIKYPDNFVSNIYTKFRPANRLGLTALAGMEFRLSKKMDLNVGIKGVWVNAFPKRNFYVEDGYETYVNDSKSYDGIEFQSSKQVMYFQVVTGITLPLGFK